MDNRFIIPVLGLLAFASCHNGERKDNAKNELTAAQRRLLDAGWVAGTPDEDLTEHYGIKPVYGTQDNYFDITMGSGCSVAVKIMDWNTDECIRYVYVAENTTTTIQEIPQGIYYLKLAYGDDWMEYGTGRGKQGKFTRKVSYERSQDTFDFGVKNSRNQVSYRLEINVVDSRLDNNFVTTPINEDEFMR